MQKNRCFLLLILALILTGCSGLQKTFPVKRFYGLDVNPGFSSQDIRGTDTAEAGKSVLVRELRISPPYDSHAFVYKMGPQSYKTDFYNEFITYPTKLISEIIAEQLYASVYFSPPVSDRKQSIDYRISGKITRLYGDFQVTASAIAVIEIRLILEEKEKDRFIRVFSHTYRHDAPLDLPRPEQLSAGWSKGLEKIMIDFIDDYKDTRQLRGPG